MYIVDYVFHNQLFLTVELHAMSGTYFKVIFLIFFCVFTGCGGFYSKPALNPFSNHQNCQCSHHRVKSRYIVYPQYNPTCGSIFSNDPSVVAFTNTFMRIVSKSDLLGDVFDLSQTTALDLSLFMTGFIANVLDYFCINDADSLAEFATRAIRPNFDVLTAPLIVRVKSNSVANFLYVAGILCTENAEDLASLLAETFVRHAQTTLTEDPTSKFQVLGDSLIDFILTVDENAIENASLYAYYYGTEWFVAAVNYWWVNRI